MDNIPVSQISLTFLVNYKIYKANASDLFCTQLNVAVPMSRYNYDIFHRLVAISFLVMRVIK